MVRETRVAAGPLALGRHRAPGCVVAMGHSSARARVVALIAATALVVVVSFNVSVALAAPAPSAAGAAVAALPYQSTNKHVGVATCASSVCHGSVTPSAGQGVRLDEFVTWSHQDKHSQAYAALSSEKGRGIASKLGIGDARAAKECLDCHSDNVSPAQRDRSFALSDGVSCEACHGGAAPWLASHSSPKASYAADIAHGMYPAADLRERAALCLSCHFGNEDKFATHRMMGAGHPRLSFELDTYLALQPPHSRVDDSYRKRKPTYPRMQVWAYGQVAAVRRELQMLQGPRLRDLSLVPELALFDCHACHENPLHRLDWSRGLLTRLTQPGSLTFPDGHLKMAVIVARRIDDSQARDILSLGQSLQKAAGENRERVQEVAAQLSRAIDRTAEAVRLRHWTLDDGRRMLADVIQMGCDGEYRDYVSAEQAVMATELLMIDVGSVDTFRADLDELYRLVRNDDAYDPSRLIEAMRRLAAALPRGAT